MAEVVKKKTEDKYNTSSIKKKDTKKEIKKDKDVKKNNKNSKDKKRTNEKKGLLTRFRIFCSGVKSEFKRIHWPERKDMIKYSIASIFFIVFCSLFFYVINVIFALVQSLFN